MNGLESGRSAEPSLGQYRKFLLNRLTASSQFSSFLQAELARDDEHSKHIFHKIMVHKWSADAPALFAALTERCGAQFMPVCFEANGDLCHFYTDSLSFIHKVIGFDFIFPYDSTMFNVDVLFGDRTSTEILGAHVTTEQLVSGVVSRRFSNTLELHLDDVCADPELKEKRIHLHDVAQLALYKRLMLRLGRDTMILNLSKNGLVRVPQEIMNFFMRGDLIGVNLSDNNIQSLEKLPRMSSLLERLWLEGNPLCEEEDATSYVKKVTLLFPRLQELDGVPVNRHGFVYPFVKNYLVNPAAKNITEKFLTLFFSHYDSSPRSTMADFYHPTDALLSISTSLTDEQLKRAKHLRTFSRNMLSAEPAAAAAAAPNKLYTSSHITSVYRQLPETTHDPTTFTVDVLAHSTNRLTVTVDGVVKERREEPSDDTLRIFQFRRTFLIVGQRGHYHICNELLHLRAAADDMVRHAFNKPVGRLNELCLVEPAPELTHTLMAAFAHLTNLNSKEVERRLKVQNWDVRKALLVFQDELKSNRIAVDMFADPALDDLTDDEID